MQFCYTSQMGVQSYIPPQSNCRFVLLRFAYLDCHMAFSNCRLATHSIYVLGYDLHHRSTEYFNPDQNTGSPSQRDSRWCHYDSCWQIWPSLSGYEGHWGAMSVNNIMFIDLSKLVRNICIIYKLVLHTLLPPLNGMPTQTNVVTVLQIYKSICLSVYCSLKWGESEEAWW